MSHRISITRKSPITKLYYIYISFYFINIDVFMMYQIILSRKKYQFFSLLPLSFFHITVFS